MTGTIIQVRNKFVSSGEIPGVAVSAVAGAPGNISDLSTSQVDSSTLSLSFTPATGSTSTEYRYAPRVNQSSGSIATGLWTAAATLSGANITGLWPQHFYDVQVRGVSIGGTRGAWSNTASGAQTATATDNASGNESMTPTGDTYLDGMLAGLKWHFTGTPNVISFSFPSAASNYAEGSTYTAHGGNIEPNTFTPFNTTQQDATRRIMFMRQMVCGLRFVEITESDSVHAKLRYGNTTFYSAGASYYPSVLSAAGDSWVNPNAGDITSPQEGNYGFNGIMHESGHGLGLKHPHEVSGSFPKMGDTDNGTGSSTDRDDIEFTAMTYRGYIGQPVGDGLSVETWGYEQFLGMYDIAGIQACYGANYDLNGDTTYTFNASTGVFSVNGVAWPAPGGNKVLRTIWDGGGNDTLNLTTGGYVNGDPTVDLTPGKWSTLKSTQIPNGGGGTHLARGNLFNSLRFSSNTNSDIENSSVP